MSKWIFLILSSLPCLTGLAQKGKNRLPAEIRVPMTAEKWDCPSSSVQFLDYKSVPAMKMLTNNIPAILKDFTFTSGTIEYDIDPGEAGFSSLYFRRQDSAESELFYFRVPHSIIPHARDGVQYTPIIKGVNMWDMLDQYQGPVVFKKDQWNHVKLVISGSQMLVYVNDMAHPALEIPQLEGNTTQGGLAFDGKAYIANLVIRPGETEGLSPAPGFDPTYQDPRYIRSWTVTQPAALPTGCELTAHDLPPAGTSWEKIEAERRGLIDLSRIYGLSKERRVVWLRARLKVETDQRHHVDFGLSDEAWVFINGQYLFSDKNIYVSAFRKDPDGRCTTENSSFTLPLKAGVNELLIGVANDFYGWGIIAKLDNMEGVELVE